MIAQAIGLSVGGNAGDFTHLALTFSVQAYTYFYILFLLVGTRQVLKEDKIPSQNYWFFGLMIIGVSLVVTFLFHNDSTASTERYFLRLGVKSFITGISFVSVGVLLLRKAVLGNGLGYRMLYISLILFGLMQGYYFLVVLVNSTGGQLSCPIFFGLAAASILEPASALAVFMI